MTVLCNPGDQRNIPLMELIIKGDILQLHESHYSNDIAGFAISTPTGAHALRKEVLQDTDVAITLSAEHYYGIFDSETGQQVGHCNLGRLLMYVSAVPYKLYVIRLRVPTG